MVGEVAGETMEVEQVEAEQVEAEQAEEIVVVGLEAETLEEVVVGVIAAAEGLVEEIQVAGAAVPTLAVAVPAGDLQAGTLPRRLPRRLLTAVDRPEATLLAVAVLEALALALAQDQDRKAVIVGKHQIRQALAIAMAIAMETRTKANRARARTHRLVVRLHLALHLQENPRLAIRVPQRLLLQAQVPKALSMLRLVSAMGQMNRTLPTKGTEMKQVPRSQTAVRHPPDRLVVIQVPRVGDEPTLVEVLEIPAFLQATRIRPTRLQTATLPLVVPKCQLEQSRVSA